MPRVGGVANAQETHQLIGSNEIGDPSGPAPSPSPLPHLGLNFGQRMAGTIQDMNQSPFRKTICQPVCGRLAVL